MKHALHRPVLGEEELQAVAEVLESGHLVQGPRVAAFEAKLAEILDIRHVVAVSSGTAALHVSTVALGLSPHDEVIVPAFGHGGSQSCNRITCLMTSLVDQHGGTTKVMSRVWLDIHAVTSWCPRHVMTALMI